MNSHTETIQQSIEYIFKSREYKKYVWRLLYFLPCTILTIKTNRGEFGTLLSEQAMYHTMIELYHIVYNIDYIWYRLYRIVYMNQVS